ncbi:aminotransferase class I/II-fold pyridoxal phosphate-dependent enzyme [Roseicella aquatilis]|uniref:Aminotransferase class I/II-fold pyridoxal phosphate-dependent enzyme n=1 Tax=Roseicella aquatilis TaxID=2527868 RepID=A0A4R4DA31_9PROT|nr:aminotransferase class I/II-fold pyridoxal phosphate-dependent enzyme [Roseicella aquatilis]TCZ57275.1 aminotransferase class I/II-fold pyridoxal phosphate-dependent enzyme [Roseicella aquatilis]
MLDLMEAPGSALEPATAFVAPESANLWTGIELALDNGHGVVFVTDAQGQLLGQVTLDAMRAAIRKGAHLGDNRLADLVQVASHNVVSPVLGADGRVVGIRRRPEAAGLPVAEPDLSHAELRGLLDAFLSTWISSAGDHLRSFEQRFAARSGMAHGVATSNGTVSLHLAMAALGIGPGDEVIVPDLTFAACANTVMHLGARPVLVDIDPDTWCLSVDAMAKVLTPRTRAIMVVHLFGRPAPMTEISAFARAHGLFVIEDCAEAHGARYDGRPIGSFSDIASYSFFANKIITTGEGGICLTNNPDLAVRLRMLRDHGMRPERKYWFEEAGFNYRMTNLQAAIGCAQLDRMDGFLAQREAVDARYAAAFAGIPGLRRMPPMSDRCEPVVWFSSVLVPRGKRQPLIETARQRGIDLRPFVNSLSLMPAYRHYARNCPVSAEVSATGLHLPTTPKVDDRLAGVIADVFRDVLAADAAGSGA